MEEKYADEQMIQTAGEAAVQDEEQAVPATEGEALEAAVEGSGDQTPSETALFSATETTAEPLHTSEPDDSGRAGGNSMLMVIVGLALLAVIAVVAGCILIVRRRRAPAETDDFIDVIETDEDCTTESPEADESSSRALDPAEVPSTEFIGSPTKHPRFDIGTAATIGGRKEQQDSFYCSKWTDESILDQRGLLVAVADGIGGLADGSLASSAAMKAMQSSFVQGVYSSRGSRKLLSLAAAAQRDVLNINQSGHQCGCTLVSVLIENWDLYLASVGDSRIYLYRGGGLIVLNREHTLQRENDERMAVAHEEVSPENLRRGKAITSYLGKVNLRLIDRTVYPLRLLPGDKIALMSDGIFGTLSDEEIANALRKPPQEAAADMVASIDKRNDPRQDNATVVVISVQ